MRVRRSVADDFPSELATKHSQFVRQAMTEHNDIIRVEGHYEI